MEKAFATVHGLRFSGTIFCTGYARVDVPPGPRTNLLWLPGRRYRTESGAKALERADDWEGGIRGNSVAKSQMILRNLSESDEPQGGRDDASGKTAHITGKSRGEIFLERALERRVAKTQDQTATGFKLTKERTQKKEKPKVAKSSEPCCYGCGALLQYAVVEAPGYLPLDTFELKKKHHQLKTVLCGRCVLLSQGHMIPAVSGNGGYGSGKGFVSADELRSQLSHLRQEKALIVKLVDIVDFNGSFLTRVRDLIGANPVILVATKVDLLPKGTDLAAVGDWLIQATLAKKLNVISIHLTSAKAGTGISGVAGVIQRQRQGRDVYILGSANVGKSALINTLLQEMGQRDPVAAAAQRYRPVQSAMPGTTLGPIQIEAFSGGGSLYDTPGVHLHHRMAAAVSPDDLPLLAPRRRLSGRVVTNLKSSYERPLTGSSFTSEPGGEESAEQLSSSGEGGSQVDDLKVRGWQTTEATSLVGQSLLWGGIARFDVVQAPANATLTLYGPSSIPVITVPTSQAQAFYIEELGRSLFPPAGVEKAASWSGLVNQHVITLTLDSASRPAGDITISGLGWVTLGTTSRQAPFLDEACSAKQREIGGTFIVNVHTPKAVEVFVRPPMPVGASAVQWYEYTEVDDDESEAARPSLVF